MRKFMVGRMTGVTAALLLVGAMAAAQGPDVAGGAQRQQRAGNQRAMALPDVPIAMLADICELTADQKDKLTPIKAKYDADIKALQPAEGAAPDPTVRQKRTAVRRQATTDMQAILTTEQKDILKKAAPVLALARQFQIPLDVYGDLKLTAEQKNTLQSIVMDVVTKVEAVPATERTAKRRELLPDARTKVQALLTVDQKAIIEKWRKDHPRPNNANRRSP